MNNARTAKFCFTEQENALLSPEFRDMICSTLRTDYEKRPNLQDFVNHSFFTSYKPYWQLVEELEYERSVKKINISSLEKLIDNLVDTTPPFSWKELKDKLSPSSFMLRSSLKNFSFAHPEFEASLGPCEERPAFTYPNGKIYKGQWQVGTQIRQGRGTMIYTDGALYEGYYL